MALGEIGLFLPAESAYGTPGAYSQALRAEATKRASYLSQMDQFYAQLEESQRQFDEMMEYREEELSTQKALGFGNLLLGLLSSKTQAMASRRSSTPISLGRDKELDFLREAISSESKVGESAWLGPGFSYPSTGRAGMYD